MSDDSPFDDFGSASSNEQNAISDTPIALPPPDDAFHSSVDQFESNEFESSTSSSSASTSSTSADFDDFDSSSSSSSSTLDEDPFSSVESSSSSSSANQFTQLSNAQDGKQDEETPLSVWEKNRKDELSRRAQQAQDDKQNLINTAKAELDKFYSDRDTQLQKNQKTNRADEKNYKSDMSATMAHGTRWEKVAKLVSLQPKANDKTGATRTERMRKLLTQLKTAKEA